MQIEASKQRVRDFFDALTRVDRPAMEKLVAENVTWVIPKSSPPPYAGSHHGREKVLDMMFGAADEIFVKGTHRIEIEFMVAEADAVAAEIRMSATTPKGQDYVNQYVFLFRLDGNGVITEFREHLDTRYAAPFLDR